MKSHVSWLAGLVFLAGCTPLSLYYKEGAPVERLTRDEAQCELDGLKAVPVDMDTRFIPGTESPKTICDANGNCRTVWVQITPDRFERFDANEGARRQYIESCMGQKGYQRVRLPACSQQVVDQTALSPTRTLPRLEENSCAIRFKTGQWQVVTP